MDYAIDVEWSISDTADGIQEDILHQLHIRRESGEYVHVFYQNFREIAGDLYTLRLETRPENYGLFPDVMEQLRNVASEINFVSCDVAYDVP